MRGQRAAAGRWLAARAAVAMELEAALRAAAGRGGGNEGVERVLAPYIEEVTGRWRAPPRGHPGTPPPACWGPCPSLQLRLSLCLRWRVPLRFLSPLLRAPP